MPYVVVIYTTRMAVTLPDSFYVTLPSGTNLDLYPNNSVTHYTTELRNSIDFDEQKYEVGLAEIHLRGNLINLEKKNGTLLHIIIEISKEEYETNFKNSTPISNLIESIRNSNNTVVLYEQLGKYLCRIDVRPHPASYNNITELVWGINTILNPNEENLLYLYIKYSGYLILKGELTYDRIFWVVATDSFKKLISLQKLDINPIITNEKNVFRINTYASLYSDTHTGEILVYSDIVEYNHIGNTMGQLLRVVSPNQNNTILRTSVVFHSPHYVSVISNRISSINLELRSLTGDYFPIESGHCIIKLHFRKIE